MCDAKDCTNIGETKSAKLPDGNTMELCVEHYGVVHQALTHNRIPSWENVPE